MRREAHLGTFSTRFMNLTLIRVMSRYKNALLLLGLPKTRGPNRGCGVLEVAARLKVG